MLNLPVPAPSPRVLIVEDEDKIAEVLRQYLALQGLSSHRLSRGDEVLPWVQAHRPDLVLLDRMLPGGDGLSVCRTLREHGCDVAVLMLTARVDEADRLEGLGSGADDYICKPFSPREVVARVQAQLRRSERLRAPAPPLTATKPPPQPDAGLVLDSVRHRAWMNGHPLPLTTIEFQLLRVLTGQPGRVFSREQLMDGMYRDDRAVSDRTVDSHIRKLRRKLADARQHPDEPEPIHAVYGLGYTYDPQR